MKKLVKMNEEERKEYYEDFVVVYTNYDDKGEKIAVGLELPEINWYFMQDNQMYIYSDLKSLENIVDLVGYKIEW